MMKWLQKWHNVTMDLLPSRPTDVTARFFLNRC